MIKPPLETEPVPEEERSRTLLGQARDTLDAHPTYVTHQFGSMLGTAGTVGVILVPVVLIAAILAMWYCPCYRASLTPPDNSIGTITGIAAVNPVGANGVDVDSAAAAAAPYTAPSYELQPPHRAFRLSRISEEGAAHHVAAAHR
ncbi:hypothetical protein M426DRAFT_13406 [Hypoxylon sp. CI-4A]|nr:hypothetical protein M426DRAFT_13406 [Hypoxylon sp. CI-4A]